jgi:hypothetical protein
LTALASEGRRSRQAHPRAPVRRAAPPARPPARRPTFRDRAFVALGRISFFFGVVATLPLVVALGGGPAAMLGLMGTIVVTMPFGLLAIVLGAVCWGTTPPRHPARGPDLAGVVLGTIAFVGACFLWATFTGLGAFPD